MKKLEEILEIINKEKASLKNEFGVHVLGVFGSYVKGETKIGSDLDILVELEKDIGFFTFLELEERLSKLTGIKVDLVMKETLKPMIGKRILEELVKV